MRFESHLCLGRYLADGYLSHLPRRQVTAFLAGCVQPDKNPLTYLKGSIGHQWLRGHNYPNARRFLERTARHLERKQKLNLLDCYRLGKLVHYTADAFTCAHNDWFPLDLRLHRNYEAALQEYFLACLAGKPRVTPRTAAPIGEAIRSYHRDYAARNGGPATDTIFALTACSFVVSSLFSQPIPHERSIPFA